jgi:hypothetical protein
LNPLYANLPGQHAIALVTNDSWMENALTWNTKPGSEPVLASWLPQVGVPVQLDLAGVLPAEQSGDGLLSLRVHAITTTSDGRVDYASKESAVASPPTLRLVHTNLSSLSATQSFLVTVASPQPPLLAPAGMVEGRFSMTVAGDAGPDYTVWMSTNLVDWSPLLTTNAPAMPFVFTDAEAATMPCRFYRVTPGP